MKIVVLGATGMLGHTMLAVLANIPECEVIGAVRNSSTVSRLPLSLRDRCKAVVNTESHDQLVALFETYRPDVVINCVGLVKQIAEVNDPLAALPINSILPHRLARLCGLSGARLIHISTDCVFSGQDGGYVETDTPDALDLYGRSKLLGEVDYPHAITLRTSIIGHELSSARGLIDWFLSQCDCVRGYTEAIFSGLPTCEIANIVRDFVLPRPELRGVYHVASVPISKYDLLKLVSVEYGKQIEVAPDDKVKVDRSLDATRFENATGYKAPSWRELIAMMRSSRLVQPDV